MLLEGLGPSTQWVATHPWGRQRPEVIVTDSDGFEILADVDYDDGQVTVWFGHPTAGSLQLRLSDPFAVSGGSASNNKETTKAVPVMRPGAARVSGAGSARRVA